MRVIDIRISMHDSLIRPITTQMLHIVDSVLQPLAPISVRDAEYFVNLDARKLLTKSTLYELDGHRARVFYQQTDENRRTHMFGVEGRHTFFVPVDEAFDVSRHVSGYDHDRSRLKSSGSGGGRGAIYNTGGPVLDWTVLTNKFSHARKTLFAEDSQGAGGRPRN